MKRRYIKEAAAVMLGMLLVASCSKDFIEVSPKATALEANYYTNETEYFAGLVSVYDPLGREAGSSYANKLGALNSASDDCYAGGGSSTDMATWQAWNSFKMNAAVGPQLDLWNRNYLGINRANVLLSKLGDEAPVSAQNLKRYRAECKTLRAYFYSDLVTLFKNVPLILAPVPSGDVYKIVQAAPADVYKQIEKDLTEAIPDLPAKLSASENGRVTSGMATALLGKVILFQNDETRMKEAADHFKEVNGVPGGENTTYGYKLLSNFGAIFSPLNKFNSESIFEIVHTSKAKEGWGDWGRDFEGNMAIQMFGARGYSGPTYSSGWGFNPLTTELVDLLKGDPRYKYTVANIDSIVSADPKRSYDKGYNNTGYFIQKFAPLTQYRSSSGGAAEVNWPNDYIEIRLADTYLMEAEALVRAGQDLTRAKDLLNAVRARVGLPAIEATLDNIAMERRLELATEGHRFLDLVRTGKAETELKDEGFVKGINEILPIPLSELTNTKLVQNEGY